MKKVILIFTVLLAAGYFPLQSQNWQGLGKGLDLFAACFYEDTINDLLYVGGNFQKVDGIIIPGIATWNGYKWDSLIGGGLHQSYSQTGYNQATVYNITNYKNELYIGGHFRYADTMLVYSICRWNGANWQKLGNGLYNKSTEFYGSIRCMQVFNDTLYIAGFFDSLIGSNKKCYNLIKWDGDDWQEIDTIPIQYWGFVDLLQIYNMAVYKNELYVAGNFGNYNDTMKEIARWDGKNWHSVGGGLKGNSFISSITEYKGELYVGGYFKKSDGNAGNYIMKWDGANWSEVGGGAAGTDNYNGQVSALKVLNGELYAAGVFSYAGGVPAQYIAKWDGIKWCGLGSSFDNTVSVLGVYNDMLYIGGGFWTIDGDSIRHIAKWTGGSYTDTCSAGNGVAEMNEEEGIRIYPNPSTATLTLQFPQLSKKAEVYIYDMQGRLLLQKEIKKVEEEINVSGLMKGMYIVRVRDEKGVAVRRFVKE